MTPDPLVARLDEILTRTFPVTFRDGIASVPQLGGLEAELRAWAADVAIEYADYLDTADEIRARFLDLDALEATARKTVLASPEHLGVFALIAEVRRLRAKNEAQHTHFCPECERREKQKLTDKRRKENR